MLITKLLFPVTQKLRASDQNGFQIRILHRKIELTKPNLTKPNLTKPNLLITSKLLVFHAYLIHYCYNSKNKGERQKLTSDSASTSKNT